MVCYQRSEQRIAGTNANIRKIIMKNFYFILILFFNSLITNGQGNITEQQQMAFEQIARTFQINYMNGSENCESIVQAIDKKIIMSELRFMKQMTMKYEQLVQFCPHLPKKEVINTITEQRLLSVNLGYDYVSQLYLRKSVGDTVRETSTRIWKLKDDEWKIVQMNSSLNKHCD